MGGEQATPRSGGPKVPVQAAPRANRVGTISLLLATGGAIAARVLQHHGPFVGASWLSYAVAGFDAAMVGGLADWFAVTALFRHPLGLPIPHTAIIPRRRDRIIESIVSMVQDEWLSPAVLSARLQRVAPSAMLIDWLGAPESARRLGAPVRDLIRAVSRLFDEPEVVGFLERTLQREVRAVPVDASAGRWLLRAIESEATASAFESGARSLAALARRPQSADALQLWLDRAARQLHADGKRLVPLLLGRKLVQRKLVEAACDYVAGEADAAGQDRDHRVRRAVFGAARRFGTRLAAGDPGAVGQVEAVRRALVESLEARPLVRDLMGRLREQIDEDLSRPESALARLVDDQLRSGILGWMDSGDHRARFDDWVRATAKDLLERHHHQIGLTVRENLEALETDALVAQIEARVGNDLQFVRLNGALVGGLIGVLLALFHASF